jgi:hypothetical protein
MKKTAIIITIVALLFSFASQATRAIASEVSGTIGTNGTQQNPEPSPTPTPTPTPTPDNGGHSHSSEVGGTIDNNTSTDTTNTGSNSGSSGNSGNDMSGNVTGGSSYIYVGENVSYRNSDGTSGSQDTQAATSPATTTTGISDEELARLALVNFGPRYGVGGGGSSQTNFTPGAPDAGGMSSLSLTQDDSFDASDLNSPFAYVPRSGEGPVASDDSQLAAAGTIVNASGMSMTQLALIAFIGLILLASMGYAISKSHVRTTV